MKYLIWDYNGTIVNDTRLCFEIEMKMLRDRGMKADFDMDWYLHHFRFPVIEYYKDMGYDFEKEDFNEIAIEFNELYNAEFLSCPLCEGFEEKINESINKGYQNVIVSASHEDNLKNQCEAFKIDKYFDELIGIDNLHAGSKVERAREWMSKNNINPVDCKYIGDSEHDKDVALALGIEDYILVANGHQAYDVLNNISDKVVNTLYDVEL